LCADRKADQKVVLSASTAVVFRASAIPRGVRRTPLAVNLPLTGPKRLPAMVESEKARPEITNDPERSD
jgi:hypothetical protein